MDELDSIFDKFIPYVELNLKLNSHGEVEIDPGIFEPNLIDLEVDGDVEYTSSFSITKEMIVKFLKDNIETVTLITIQHEFNISYRKLVSILGESPGKVIEFERKKILYAKSNKGKRIEELSKLTGYSVQYLKKISNKTKI